MSAPHLVPSPPSLADPSALPHLDSSPGFPDPKSPRDLRSRWRGNPTSPCSLNPWIAESGVESGVGTPSNLFLWFFISRAQRLLRREEAWRRWCTRDGWSDTAGERSASRSSICGTLSSRRGFWHIIRNNPRIIWYDPFFFNAPFRLLYLAFRSLSSLISSVLISFWFILFSFF